jgi:hypothetical protein
MLPSGQRRLSKSGHKPPPALRPSSPPLAAGHDEAKSPCRAESNRRAEFDRTQRSVRPRRVRVVGRNRLRLAVPLAQQCSSPPSEVAHQISRSEATRHHGQRSFVTAANPHAAIPASR